jgi:hypothetical protein
VIALCGLVMPQVVLGLVLDLHGDTVAGQVRELFKQKSSAAGSFLELAAPAIAYLRGLSVAIILLSLLFVVSYLALVHLAVAAQREEPPPSAARAFALGLKTTLPRGLFAALGLVVCLVIGQALVFPALLVAVLGLIVPVVLVSEQQGAIRSLVDALSLRYVRRSDVSAWSVVFLLLTVVAVFYTGLAAISALSESALDLDSLLELPRRLWVETLPSTPFSVVYLGISVLETALIMGLAACLPAFTTALYFFVVGKRELAQA